MASPLHPFTNLPALLANVGFDRPIVASTERVLSSDETPLIDLRLLLELFFRNTSQMDKSIRFSGDLQSFGATLAFARSRNWVTEKEHRFLSALYGLLSDAAAHPGQSVVERTVARCDVLYALWLVINRLEVRISHPFGGFGGSAGRLRLANQFLKGVRTGDLKGPGFEAEFDQDLMQLTRERLAYSDIAPLMMVIKNDAANADLRSNCASLILSPRCYRKPTDDNWAKTIRELDRYCEDMLSKLPWQVSRAIALALANRTNHPDRLLDYLDWIGRDEELIEVNLAESDAYNGGTERAVDYYMSRIKNRNLPLSGCVWETYYVSNRGGSKQKQVLKRALAARRINELEPPRLRAFFQSICDTLPPGGHD